MSRFPFRPSPSREPLHRRNGKIRAREVRVLDEAKQPLGVMALTDALRLAQNRGLDLVEIAPNAVPPVCRLIEYGKFLYEESKRKKDSATKQPSNQMKELQLSANIEEHDFQTKLSHAIEFLDGNMKVRVKLRFRGRQRAHKEFGFQIVERFVQGVAAFGKADSAAKMAGDRDLHVTISPLPRDQRPKSRPGAAEAGAPGAPSPAPKAAAPASAPAAAPASAPAPAPSAPPAPPAADAGR